MDVHVVLAVGMGGNDANIIAGMSHIGINEQSTLDGVIAIRLHGVQHPLRWFSVASNRTDIGLEDG